MRCDNFVGTQCCCCWCCWTDLRTDQRTDTTSYRDATAHLKREKKKSKRGQGEEGGNLVMKKRCCWRKDVSHFAAWDSFCVSGSLASFLLFFSLNFLLHFLLLVRRLLVGRYEEKCQGWQKEICLHVFQRKRSHASAHTRTHSLSHSLRSRFHWHARQLPKRVWPSLGSTVGQN